MERLSFEEAKRLSVKKWQMHADAGGYDLLAAFDRELCLLDCNCGFCERHKPDGLFSVSDCNNCELGKVAGKCTVIGSLYDKWYREKTKGNAQKILDVIKNLEE